MDMARVYIAHKACGAQLSLNKAHFQTATNR
jgi:hypothetical protein